MIRKNNKYNVFYGYEDGQKVYVIRPKTYLNYLEFLTDNNDCIENYKFCGILDTYGNKFCFPKNDACPINDIIIDSSNKESSYISNGYGKYKYGNTNDNLYYKRGNLNSNIIAYWYFNYKSQPKYIDGSNFILDKGAFEEIFGSNDDDNNNKNERINRYIN